MKYIVDESITIHYPDKYSGSNYTKSIDVVGRGASDDKILSVVRKTKRGLITRDRKFAIHALWAAKTVIYHKSDGTRIQIKPNRKKLRPWVTDGTRLTNYALENDQIVIP